jgi:DNA-binding MarR family transcriptional regulator
MEVHQIRYFLALAEALHFSRAADRCHVSQPSLSRAIKKLEDEIGGDLFERRPGSVNLTELGRYLKPHLQRALEYILTIKEEAAAFLNLREQNLRLGIMNSVFYPQMSFLITKLSDMFPEVMLHIERGAADYLQSRLISGELDIAILCRKTLQAEQTSKREKYGDSFRERDKFIRCGRGRGKDCTSKTKDPTRGVRSEGLGAGDRFALRLNLPDPCVSCLLPAVEREEAIVPEFAPLPRLNLESAHGSASLREIGVATMRGRPRSPAALYFIRLILAVEDWREPGKPTEAARH